MEKFQWRKVFFVFLTFVAFAGGFLGGRLSGGMTAVSEDAQDRLETRQSGYTFINPLLECDVAEGRINTRFTPFRSTIKRLISEKIDRKEVDNVAVYFRDLNNGLWFGIGEQDDFIPASLMKVPLMMDFYKIAETHPEVLDTMIHFNAKYEFQDIFQTILPSLEIEPGNDYTVEELIERAIIHSDNQAAELLTIEGVKMLQEKGYLTNQPNYLSEDINLLDSFFGEKKEVLSVKNYSTYFRVLFNASFLNRQYSERALAILSKVEYRDALVAGIPENIIVSHKFGEGGQAQGMRQLHDCGIVYYPKRPYLLCVMTKGSDPSKLAPTIADISQKVYEEVDAQSKK